MCTSIYLVVFYILHELTSAYPAQHEAVSNMPSQKVHVEMETTAIAPTSDSMKSNTGHQALPDSVATVEGA